MSKTIDERVVSMQFDNKNFEANVRTTMSTLDKLKARLNLSGASKGLEGINAAASKCNLSPISNAVDTVNVKFSKLQAAAAHALGDIATRAYRTGESILKSLTIAPVTTGFNEYELKMNSIQTIMASTGESLETVNQYLNELNKYSDETIYSFSDMTQNIGKFTNAGIKLEDAVTAIKGIANEAALSGANANEAARSMYNFSQALSTGYVQRIDWKSIELANMATIEFKEQLLEQAVAMGTVKKNAEGMYSAINDSKFYNTSQMFIECLDEQWLTSEVLIETLKDYADETTDIGARATKAATEVKTFSHMMDTLRESAQSGWAQTWETILGDFDEGKTLWTSLNEVIGGWISKSADKRNGLLGTVLDSNWEKLADKVEKAGVPIEEFQQALIETGKTHGKVTDEMIKEEGGFIKSLRKNWVTADIVIETLEKFTGATGDASKATETITDKIKYFQKAFDKVWRGDFGNGAERFKALAEAGYDYATVQGLVNKHAAGYKLTAEDLVDVVANLSEEQLKNVGFTEEEVKALSELKRQAEETGTPLRQLIDDLSKPTGRELVIESFVKIFEKFKPVIEGFKSTWDKVFGDFPTVGELLTTLIDKFANFADELVINEDKIQSITKTFEGLITVLKMAALLSGGAAGYIFKLINMIANELDVDFFNITETIAEIIIQFYKFITTNNVLYKSLIRLGDAVIEFATSAIKGIKDFINWFLQLPNVTVQIEKLTSSFEALLSNIGPWLSGFGTIFSDFFNNLLNLDSITFDGVISAIGELISGIFEQLRTVISGIDSPFTDLIDLVVTFFAELINGKDAVDDFADNFSKIKGAVNTVIDPISKAINKLLEWGDTFAAWVSSLKDVEDVPEAIGEGIGKVIGGIIVYIRDLVTGLAEEIWAGMTGVGEDGVAGLVNGIVSGITNVASAIWDIGTTMITTIMEVLDEHSPSKVMMAIGAFAIVGLALGLMQGAPELWAAIVDFGKEMLAKFSDAFIKVLDWIKNINIGQVISVAVTAGMLAFAVSVVKIGMRIADAVAGISEGIAGMAKGASKILGNIGNIFGEIAKNKKAKRFAIYAEAIKSLAIAIGILAASIAVLTLVADEGEMWSAVGAIVAILAAFAAFAAVMALTEKIGKISALKFGAMALGMTGIAIGITIVASAAKKLSEVPTDKLGGVVSGMIGFMLGLTALVTLFGAFAKGKVVKNIDKLGGVLLRMGAVMLAMAFTAKILGTLDASQVEQGRDVIVTFGLVIAGLVAVTQLAGNNLKAIGNVILKIGGVFLLMAYVMKLMSGFTQAEIDKGISAITSFAGIVVATTLLMRLISMIPGKSGSESGGGKLEGIGSTILQVAGALFIIAAAAMMLGSMNFEELKQAGNAIVGLVAVIGVLLAGLNAINAGNLKDVGSTILMVAGSILVIAAAAKLLGSMEWQELLAATVVIGAFGAGIYFMIQSLGKIKAKNLKGVGMTLLFAAGAIAILATIASVIGFIPLDVIGKGIGAVAAIGLLIMGLIKVSEKAKDVKSTLIGISIAMAVLSAAIVAISLIAKDNPVAVLESVAAIGLTMVVLAAVLNKLGKTKLNVKPLLAITGMITVLGGTLILLGRLNPGNALAAALALSATLLALSGTMVIINKFGSTSGAKKGPHTLKLLAMLAAVALAVGAAIAIIGRLEPGEALAAAAALSVTMVIMALLTSMMGKLGSGGSVGALLAMSVALLAIGVSMNMIAQIPADKLAGVFGTLVGAIVIFTIALIALAAAFTAFAPGAALVVGALLAISLAAVAIGAAAILFAGALYIVGAALPMVADGLTLLVTSLAGCSDSAWAFIGVCAALAVGLTLITVGLAVLSVGVIIAAAAMLVGVTLLSVGLVILSVGLVVASIGLVALSVGLLLAGAGVYVFAGGVMFAAAACEAVAVALPHMAEGFATLIETLAGCSDSAWKFLGVCAALAVGIVILTVAAGVFTVGAALMSVGLVILSVGLVIVSAAIVLFAGALLIGAAAVYVMATALSFLGTCITDGLAAGVAAGIETVTSAVAGLAESVIGTICSVLGINSPSWVMQQLGQFTGQGFALGISESEGEVSGAAEGLAAAAKDGLGTAGAEGGTEFNSEALANMDFTSLLSGSGFDTSALTGAFSAAGSEGGSAFNAGALESMDFTSLLSGSGIDTSAFTDVLGTAGAEGGTAFSTNASETATMQPTLEAMLGEISNTKPQFTEAGTNVLVAFSDGLSAASATVTGNTTAIVKAGASTARNGYSSFYSAGSYLVTGFANGISVNTFRATAAAAAMANAAEQAAKDALGIKSPSRVFKELGGYVPQGFAQGVTLFGGMIRDSVDTMAGTAINETRDVISRIADVIDSDIDSQPTIRPVLDLSDVTAGVNSIGGMFNMSPSVKAMANVGAISSMMNGRQNGSNDDVISAINKLGRDLGKSGGDTYQVNGVTYDDGSNIKNFAQAVIRQARIERRV